MTALRTVADLKRALPVGARAQVENLLHPHLSGERTVLKAQSQRWCFTFPPGHEKAGDPSGSWLDIPKAAEVRFEGETAVLIKGEGWKDAGQPWLRITPLADRR